MKIQKRTAQKFANALRSGKYKQGKNSLQSPDGFCCLGVGCKVFIPKEALLMSTFDSSILRGDFPDAQPNAPRWLKDINDDFLDKVGVRLSDLNDINGYTFDMIADLIELVYVHGALDGYVPQD